MRSTNRTALLALLAGALLIALTGALALSGHGGQASRSAAASGPAAEFAGAALPLGGPAPDFALLDQGGRRVSLRGADGAVTVLAFLYSRCGAACVLIAQQIRGALDELARPARVLLVSVEPAGDTARGVRRFLAQVSLTGRVSYLTGSPAQLRRIWRAYGVTPASAGRAAFARTASVLLLDAQARRRVLFGQEQLTPESLAHDIRLLRGG